MMSKGDLVEAEGTVEMAYGNGSFLIHLNADAGNNKITCKLAGRLRKNTIRVLPGDRVKVAMSPYDLTHGLITYRMK